MSEAKKSGGCLKTILALGAAGFVFVAVIAGAVYWQFKKSFVTDSAQVIALFQEAVPGATIPEGYEGALAFDKRSGITSDKSLETTVAKMKDAPEDGWLDRIVADNTMQFESYSFKPDASLGFDTWEWKFRATELPSSTKQENITLDVGGQETRCQRLTLESGAEMLLFLIPGDELTTFLMIRYDEESKDQAVIDEFLKGLTPINQRDGWPPAPEASASPAPHESPTPAAEATPAPSPSASSPG